MPILVAKETNCHIWQNNNYLGMLAQGSYRFVVPPFVLVAILLLIQWYLIAVVVLGCGIYLAWFFRDPPRAIHHNDDVLYAAADGMVKEIIEEDIGLKIAVRMSPFDVHLNRAPGSGEVTDIQYKPGNHGSVYFAGAEEKNEQNLIVLRSEGLETSILQITGAFARRIECWVAIEDKVDQGQRIGIIRFGSQTNMLFKPVNPDTMILVPLVKVGQSVRAGITPVAAIRRDQDE